MNREISDFRLSGICCSCALHSRGCEGTTNPVWTGCVYRKPDTRMEIAVIKVKASNYTPADLMHSWAKENGAQFYRTKYGSARIRYRGKIWEYDYWKIVKNKDDIEHIFLYLKKEKKKLVIDAEVKKNG